MQTASEIRCIRVIWCLDRRRRVAQHPQPAIFFFHALTSSSKACAKAWFTTSLKLPPARLTAWRSFRSSLR